MGYPQHWRPSKEMHGHHYMKPTNGMHPKFIAMTLRSLDIMTISKILLLDYPSSL